MSCWFLLDSRRCPGPETILGISATWSARPVSVSSMLPGTSSSSPIGIEMAKRSVAADDRLLDGGDCLLLGSDFSIDS